MKRTIQIQRAAALCAFLPFAGALPAQAQLQGAYDAARALLGAPRRDVLKAEKLSERLGPDARLESFCDAGDWFYPNFMANHFRLDHPYTTAYREVSGKTEAHFQARCAAAVDAPSKRSFLDGLSKACVQACGAAAASYGRRAAEVAGECARVCALDIETLDELKR